MATDKFVRRSKLRHYASRIARENRSVSTVAFEGVCAGGAIEECERDRGMDGREVVQEFPRKNQTNFHTISCKGFSSFLFLRIVSKSDEKREKEICSSQWCRRGSE